MGRIDPSRGWSVNRIDVDLLSQSRGSLEATLALTRLPQRPCRCLIALDRGACIEQHALRPQLLVEAGPAHDLERSGIECSQPHDNAPLPCTLFALHQRL